MGKRINVKLFTFHFMRFSRLLSYFATLGRNHGPSADRIAKNSYRSPIQALRSPLYAFREVRSGLARIDSNDEHAPTATRQTRTETRLERLAGWALHNLAPNPSPKTNIYHTHLPGRSEPNPNIHNGGIDPTTFTAVLRAPDFRLTGHPNDKNEKEHWCHTHIH